MRPHKVKVKVGWYPGPYLASLNKTNFTFYTFLVDRISLAGTGWASYILCGVQGVMDLLAKSDRTPVSMQLAISGNIPPSSGLSSSSALVCAGVLATALANKVSLVFISSTSSVPGL